MKIQFLGGELDLTASYNYNERVSVDTTQNQYGWTGEVETRSINPKTAEFGAPDHLITKSTSYFVDGQNYFAAYNALKLGDGNDQEVEILRQESFSNFTVAQTLPDNTVVRLLERLW